MTWWTWTVDQSSALVPVRVLAVMAEPIAYLDDGLHLDGLLQWAAWMDLDERTRRRIPPVSSADFPVDLRMPVARWACRAQDPEHHPKLGQRKAPDVLWGWQCSAAYPIGEVRRGKSEIRKRPATDEMAQWTSDGSVDLGAGTLKAYDLPLPTVYVREVEWFAVGAPEWIRDALRRHVPAVGKKRGLGFGTVAQWCVEPIDEDWSIVRAGRLARRMPVGAVDLGAIEGGMISRRAIRPPYHHRSRVARSVEPVGCL